MPSHLDLRARWEVLSETARIAASLRRKVEETISLPPQVPPDGLTIPKFTLPIPHEILAQISALEIPDNLRQSIFESFSSRVLQLQQEYISTYERTCFEARRTGSAFGQDLYAIREVFKASSEKVYIPLLKAQASFIMAEVAKYQRRVAHEERRPFNAEYTPVLEKYFEYNAYPSAAHQSILAEKSMMSRRQIEVWFQNHRNRAKKDAKMLRRNTSDLPLRLALQLVRGESPVQGRSASPLSSEDDWSTESMDEEGGYEPQSTSCIESFSHFRPQHAFPCSYPPSGSDPFPSDNGIFKFPPPDWARLPTNPTPSHRLTRSLDMEIEDLAKMFHAKLTLCDGTKKQYISKTSSKISRKRPTWFSATVTTPYPAPLPALVRAPRYTHASQIPDISSFRLPVGSLSPSPSNAFTSSSHTVTTLKASQFPFRSPTSPNTVMPFSDRSISRASFSPSEYSSRSRSSSSSSLTRTPEPATPPQPTLNIPDLQDVGPMQAKSPLELDPLFGFEYGMFAATLPDSIGIFSGDNFAVDQRHLRRASGYGSRTSPSLIHIETQS